MEYPIFIDGEVLLQLYDLAGNVRDVMAGVSLVTQVLVLAAILLAIFIMLNNRRRQLAVLRAMGATPAGCGPVCLFP